MRRSGRRLIAMALLGSAGAATAGAPAPTTEIKAALSKANVATLCGTEQATELRLAPLLGELGTAYKLNLFALPDLRDANGVTVPASAEVKAAALIVARRTAPDLTALHLTDAQSDALDAIGIDLSDFLMWIGSHSSGQSYKLSSSASVPDLSGVPGGEASRRRGQLLADFFAPLLKPGSSAPVALSCIRPVMAKVDAGGKAPASSKDSGLVIAVRGKIEDLAVPRNDPGTSNPSAAFKAASSATIAFTNDQVKGNSTVAIDATLGVGRTLTRSDAVFAFARYAQSTSETRTAGDDDDSKDIRALSPGLLYRHGTGIGGDGRNVKFTLGLTAFPTFDFAQHSRTGRVRLFFDDISFNLFDRGPLCGRQDRIGGIQYDCRVQLFAEGAHVWRAGTSADLASLEDDQYLGLGGEVQASFSLPEIEPLAPFSLSVGYRYMAVVSGPLDDPHRLTLAFAYKLAKSNLSFGIAYDDGANFDTFQHEQVTKVTVGYKY